MLVSPLNGLGSPGLQNLGLAPLVRVSFSQPPCLHVWQQARRTAWFAAFARFRKVLVRLLLLHEFGAHALYCLLSQGLVMRGWPLLRLRLARSSACDRRLPLLRQLYPQPQDMTQVIKPYQISTIWDGGVGGAGILRVAPLEKEKACPSWDGLVLCFQNAGVQSNWLAGHLVYQS